MNNKDKPSQKPDLFDKVVHVIATPGSIVLLIIIVRLTYRYFKYDSLSLF